MLGIEEKTEPIENLDNRAFGIVLHNVFKTLFDRKVSVTDKTYQQEFQSEFLNQIKEYDAYKYNMWSSLLHLLFTITFQK